MNYKQLVEMFNKHSEADGLRILGFPCNQFGGQEPGTEAEIKEFATSKYGVKWDLFAKVDVNGGNADPLWAFLKEKQSGFLINAIKWNFTKFVVDKQSTLWPGLVQWMTPYLHWTMRSRIISEK